MKQKNTDNIKEGSWVKEYFGKWATAKRCTLKVPSVSNIFWSFVASYIGILLISYIGLETDLFPLYAPYGASAVLLYGAPAAPFSQPRSLIGGHALAGLVGVTVYNLFGMDFMSIAFAVALAVALMILTKTVHPPAGATAFLGVTASNGAFMWVLAPVLAGAVVLLLVALVVNNLDKDKHYPDYWI